MALMETWEPGRFPQLITLWVKLTVLVMAMTRGVDYAAGDMDDTARRLGTAEAAAPLWVWGAILITAACLGMGSMIFRRYQGVAWSHAICWAVYWGFGVSIVWDVAQRSVDYDGGYIPPMYFCTVLLCVVAWVVHHVRPWEYSRQVAIGITVALIIAGFSIELDGLRNATALLGIGTIHMLLAFGTMARGKWENINACLQAGGSA